MSEDTKAAVICVTIVVLIVALVLLGVDEGWSYATRAELWELERRIEVLERR